MKNYFYRLKPFDKDNSYNFSVEVSATIDSQKKLNISYSILGDMTDLIIPEIETQENIKRVIGLWESTCFELFIKAPNSKNYFELNYSPEGHWNCFYFDNPGDYIKPFSLSEPPITTAKSKRKKEGFYKINIEFNLEQLIKTFHNQEQLDIGISSIVLKNHKTTYWALDHHGDLPNFHDFKSFTSWNLKESLDI